MFTDNYDVRKKLFTVHYDCIYMKFENRHNRPMVIESRIMVFSEESGIAWKGA